MATVTPVTVDMLNSKLDGSDADALWVLIAGCLVFFMQLGFGMLESGTVRSKNVNNILFKNLMDASVGAIVWFIIGYAFAYGDGNDGGFIGAANFALKDDFDYGGWFFQWTFAATAATIVSGSVAERCTIDAYFIYAIFITGFIYPVVVHWVWDGEGFLSAFNPDAKIQAMDFAGSGVVHMVGGFSGLMGAAIIGPRLQSSPDMKLKSHNVPQQVLGTLILWFGWYGFNCGSTLAVAGAMGTATRVACTTTLAAAAGVVSASVIGRFGTKGHWNVTLGCNGALAGLVSITAGCAVTSPGSAIAIGLLGGAIYVLSSWLIGDVMGIDDPLDASAVHGVCGFWGVLAVAIFADKDAVLEAGYALSSMNRGTMFKNQFLEALIVMAWSCATSAVLFLGIKATVGLRVSEDVEMTGLDHSKHGGEAYNFTQNREMGAEMAANKAPKSVYDNVDNA